MAEEKKTPAKVEEGKLTKVLTWFKKLPGRIAKPFKNMVAELRNVTWPSKKKLISSAVMVLLFMFFMGLVVGLLDLGATALVNTLVSKPSAPVEQTVDTPAVESTDATAPVETVETPAEEATGAAE